MQESEKISFWIESMRKNQLALLIRRFKNAADSTLYITALLEKIRKKEITHLSLEVLNTFADKLYYGTEELQKNVELALVIANYISTLNNVDESKPRINL